VKKKAVKKKSAGKVSKTKVIVQAVEVEASSAFSKWELCLGLFFAAVGAWALTGFFPRWGLGISAQALAAFFIIRSFPSAVVPAVVASVKPSVISKQSIFFINAAVVLLLLAAGQLEFRLNHLTLGWLLSLASLVWLFVRSDRFTLKPNFSSVLKNENLWLWILLVVALILRLLLVKTNVTGLQGDEANNLNDEIDITTDNHTTPFVTGWGGTPTMPDFIVVVFFKLFGSKLWVARLVSCIASVATLWFFYHWCRFWTRPVAAFLTTFFLAISWWYFYFSLSAGKEDGLLAGGLLRRSLRDELCGGQKRSRFLVLDDLGLPGH
jgi:Dolichyl-phosphate-mannose-protein mannosyltransferase